MRLTFCLTFCFMQIFIYTNANEGKYTVIAPGTIHSNDKYTAAVAVHYVSQPCQIKVGITGPSYNETKLVEVSQNEVKHVDFDLPTLEKGVYNLTAEGVNFANNFKNTTRLIYTKSIKHVRIQTDKGLYKPGGEINFRVLFMDKDLKPAEPEKDAVIWFEDGKRNKIKEIRDFQTVRGVYTGKLKISKYSVIGAWRLNVRSGDRYQNVCFEVKKYNLPKFIVKVEATESVSVKDGDLLVIVRASYTYGKPLNGKTTVVVFLGSDHMTNANKEPPILNKTSVMVNGKAKIYFNVMEYDSFLPYKNSPSFLSIVATVEEQYTGVKINGTSLAYVYPYLYSMNCLSDKTCSTFELGKEQDVLFQITYIDGSHLRDTKSPIELIYNEVLSKNVWWHSRRSFNDDYDSVAGTSMNPSVAKNLSVSFMGHMNETGFVNFKVTLPDLPEYEGCSHHYSLQMKYLDEQREISTTEQHRELEIPKTPKKEEMDNKSRKYFVLLDKNSLKKKLYLNKADQFTLNSSEPLPYFVFNIIGRGNILKSGRVNLPNKPKEYDLTLTPEQSWAPSFVVYLYYVDKAGRYHYAEQTYYVDFELQNQISVSIAEQVKPGQEVALKIRTTPHSFVGLMAVDQNALLMRPNNDLNFKGFNSVLGSYITNTPYQGGFSEYPGTTSGCVTLTNANYFYNWTRPDFLSNRDNLKKAVKRAAAFGNGEAGDVNGVQISTEFPKTWIFDDIQNTESAEFTWSKTIPKSINSWVLTAFSLHPTQGLGVTREQTKVKTFLNFYITIRLSFSVKTDEVIYVPVLVVNNFDKALDVNVTLDNSDDEYEFLELANELINEQQLTKTTRVAASGAAGVYFLIRPNVIGKSMLKVTAKSPVAVDTRHKLMKVVPEGVTQYANRAFLVHLKKEPKVKTSFDLELPDNLVTDSEHVQVGVMGDILGPVLNNLDNLVRLPTGSGDHTMSSLLSSYLVMKYLQNSQRLTDIIKTKLRNNLETGYQIMLNYRHNDGSFSSFGQLQTKNNPRSGSTLLTAYVVRCLHQIKEFVYVDEKIIADGLAYLSKQQASSGCFSEGGGYFYATQRNHITITGAALLAFQNNATYAEKYSPKLRKGWNFIARNIDKADSLYAQAVGTYTLNKGKHAAAKEQLSKLKSLAKIKSDRMWWSADKNLTIGNRWWLNNLNIDVEITSYALLILLDQNSTKPDDVEPIVTWLIAQRNSYGGFSSTQATIVGLTALIEFAQFTGYEPAKITVNIKSENKKESVKLTEDNGILYQIIEMPPKTKSIEFTAEGTGTALVQISYQYNIFENNSNSVFTIKTNKTASKNQPSHFEMLVCVNYVGEGESSNMAILEISTPSGYVIDNESLNDIMKIKRVGNAELKNSDTMLIVYFDHLLKSNEICLRFEAIRTHAVAMQKPAAIELYDYYDTSKKATAFYKVDSSICDICESEEECIKCR